MRGRKKALPPSERGRREANFTISLHAAERYVERCVSGISYSEAQFILSEMIPRAVWFASKAEYGSRRKSDVWIVDGIQMVVVDGVCVTVISSDRQLTEESPSPFLEAAPPPPPKPESVVTRNDSPNPNRNGYRQCDCGKLLLRSGKWIRRHPIQAEWKPDQKFCSRGGTEWELLPREGEVSLDNPEE